MARRQGKRGSGAKLPPGTGRDEAETGADQKVVADAGLDALTFLRSVLNDTKNDTAVRMRAAVTLAQYTHTRTRDGGKKLAKEEAAKTVADGKFAPAPGPKLRAVK